MSKTPCDYDVIVAGPGKTALLTSLRAHEHGATGMVYQGDPPGGFVMSLYREAESNR